MDDVSSFDAFTFTSAKTKLIYRLQLTDTLLRLTPTDNNEKKTKLINYDDVIGVKLNTSETVENGAVPSSETIHSIDIYAYPYTKPIIGSKCTRKRLCTTLTINESDAAKANQGLRQLQEAVRYRMHHRRCANGDASGVLSGNTSCDHVRFTKRLLVLLNPTSGKSLAKKLFDEKILPMFKEAEVGYELIVTERMGHGEQIAHTVDLSLYYGIVIVSGDGLLYEVYQGLMSRADATQAVQTPIGILPAGSGNALCCSINYDASEQFLRDMLMHSTYVLLKHTIRPMDLVALDTASGRVYSFLSVTWGLVADIDIESERFRTLGAARFTLEAILKIAKPRTYKGRLSFLPAMPYMHKGRSKTEIAVIDREPECNAAGTSSRARSVSMPHSPSKELCPPNGITHTHSGMDTHAVDEEAEKESTETGTQLSDEQLKSTTQTSTDVTITVYSDEELPALDHPVPDNWVKMEDSFVSVIAAYQSHLGAEFMPAPSAKLSDGLIYLLIARAPITRFQMLNLMGQMETGAHTNSNVVELVAVKAFRLEPEGAEGNLAVDGEKVKYGAIQGHVMPGVARVMAA